MRRCVRLPAWLLLPVKTMGEGGIRGHGRRRVRCWVEGSVEGVSEACYKVR